MCGREDSNLHVFRHQDLNLARLPIPPRPRDAEDTRPGAAWRTTNWPPRLLQAATG